MEECKDEAILPCYRDDTHDKVYGLNKQMCDIGKTMNDPIYPCSEETAQEMTKTLEGFRTASELEETSNRLAEHIFEDILKSIKSNDMEEKKTRLMTKAEAFEWLKGKKVNANGKGKEVQTKLFECGVGWATNHFVYYDFGDYLLIETDGRLYHCGHEGDRYWRTHHFEEISADDILSIEILEDKNNEFVDCREPCPEIKAVQELLRNSKHLKDKIIVITKDNAAIL